MDVRIVVVEDHHVVRKGLCSLIREVPGFQVVGEAETGKAAVTAAAELAPHVVVMNVSASYLKGLEATREIRRRHPAVKVLALSVHQDPAFVMEMLRAGASGFLSRTCAVPDFIRAIEVVLSGETVLDPELSGVVTGALARPGDGAGNLSSLTAAQRTIFQLLAGGMTAKQVALRLGRSVKTVEMHRRHIMEKLHINGIAGLTKLALRAGLISYED